ncbi:(2Fe-2S)-binding protein [Mongoliimonas terrestris]|uniref:(2Fe-2S)-binding protein n=1 Tax=Mongoliimonas terrestris TaxID=1709001 RepID=UPI0009496116|nr:(2Fe-2S)-binding protein [Mongoliimonas terrestris]
MTALSTPPDRLPVQDADLDPADRLLAIIQRLGTASGDVRLTAGAADEDHVALDALDDASVAAWLADEPVFTPGLNSRASAAFLMGRMSYSLCLALVALHLAGETLAVTPAAVAIRRERFAWAMGGETGLAARFHVRLLMPAALAPGSPDRLIRLRQSLEAIHGPLVETMTRASLLGRGALRRIAADCIASAFLTVCRGLDDGDRARADALAILRDPGSPLANGQTGFVHVAAERPDGSTAADWFVTRGGCCRYYTVPGETHCATCVLLRPEERRARLAEALIHR